MGAFYGIDLGTTNSAIARFDGDEIRIIKSKDNSEVVPSVVYIKKNKNNNIKILVGTKAYNTLLYDSENRACEFKRWMGKANSKYFKKADITLTAEQLSAEILKELISNARGRMNEEINNCVITVPIEFGQLQCEATLKAGNLAGLDSNSISLLQEPIAASLAYGYKENNFNDKVWLVYDFGGGTFDAAVMTNHEGVLTVIGHAGDNLLGGKDLDSAIVEEIIVPYLKEEYFVDDDLITDIKPQLSYISEQSKIQLSYSNYTELTSVSSGNLLKDYDDEEIEFSIPLEINKFNDVIYNYVEKSIDISKKALEEARIPIEELDSIILVGGTTYIPLIRERLKEEFETEIKYSQDPMTVVAAGASIYCADIPGKPDINRCTGIKDIVEFELIYNTTSSELWTNVTLNVTKCNYHNIQIKIESDNGLWDSGWIVVNNKSFSLDVLLKEKSKTKFNIIIRDDKGKHIESNISSFEIIHTGIELANPPLPHSIGAAVYDEKYDRNVLDILFDKRVTSLPTQAEIVYKANKTLKPEDIGEYINFTLYEGENNVPDMNVYIGVMKISAEQLRRPIIANDEIYFNLEIDKSRRIDITAFLPRTEQSFTHSVYVPEATCIEEEFESNIETLIEECDEYEKVIIKTDNDEDIVLIDDIKDKVSEIEIIASRCIDKKDINALQKLNRQVVEYRRNLNKQLQESKEEAKKVTLEQEVQSFYDDVSDLVNDKGTEDEIKRLNYLSRKMKRYLNSNNQTRIKKIISDLRDLQYTVLYRQFDFWEYWFNRFKLTPDSEIYNISEFNKWRESGKTALENKDIELLSTCVINMNSLIKREEEYEEIQGMLDIKKME